jgi:hypothetical protein
VTDDPVLAAVQRFMDAVERGSRSRQEPRDALAPRSRAADARGTSGPAGGERGEPGRAWRALVLALPAAVDGLKAMARAREAWRARQSTGRARRRWSRGSRRRAVDGAGSRRASRASAARTASPRSPNWTPGSRRGSPSSRCGPSRTVPGRLRERPHYARGLLATWGGSLWLSLADTRAKPGENGDWRLVVKRGADGRK